MTDIMIDTSLLIVDHVLENVPVYYDPETSSQMLNNAIVLYFLTMRDIYTILLKKMVY